jgi:DNA repair protein RadD
MSGIGHNSGAVAFNDRYYQTDAVDSVWKYFQDGNTGNPVVAMPTGTGKSIVIARLLQSIFNSFPYQRVMMLVDSKELVAQNYDKLTTLWPFAPAGVYSAGLKRKEANKQITFAGIQSVWKMAALFGHIDLILIDEVHMVPPKDLGMYRTFISALLLINPNLKLIGLTATQWRLGQGRIIDPIEDRQGNEIAPLFTDICYDITGVEDFNRLIAEGYLMPLRAKNIKALLEADGVHMRGGEFIESELQSFVDAHDELTWQALNEAKELAAAEGRTSWLIFCTGNKHADTVGQMLDALGVSNGVVHTGREGRDATISAGKAGQITATVNNNVLTKGFDNPRIDLIIMLRQTASPVLWVQMLGRGTRPLYGPDGNAAGYDLDTLGGRLAAIAAGGKRDCRVLDYAGNTRRLGPINDPVIPRRKGKGGGDAPVKECDRCNEWIHASLRDCPYCGYHFEFETKLKGEASTVELVRGSDPIVETFKVDHVSVSEHRKLNMPNSVKISYYCGLRSVFSDYIMPEHDGFGQRKSRQLWAEMGGGVMPATTKDALVAAATLTMPTHLRVWTNKQYPEILSKGRCYDGTAFGTEAPCEPPTVEAARQTSPIAALATHHDDGLDEAFSATTQRFDDLDDDVPF